MVDEFDLVLAVVADELFGLEVEGAHRLQLVHAAADLPLGLAERLTLLPRQHRPNLIDPCREPVREIGD